MVSTNQIAEIGMLVWEPARAAILGALMDGRALTATELSRIAGVTPQTASSHLARLASANLIAVQKQGRHRYHRLARPEVARMLEGIMQIASADGMAPKRKLVTGPRDAAMQRARTCYDHFAGRLGVAIADSLVAEGVVELDSDSGLLTDSGTTFLQKRGIEVSDSRVTKRKSSRPVCRPCLDWSERRPHIAGKLGAAICTHYFDKGFVRRRNGTRALEITPAGTLALRKMFGISEIA
ncbi:MAG: helix-turn-helix domain-containing protein [Alphaproteobacteria bacterium]|nr:helix-turn-helix domain-containing protein [Alphaproteobacteria bacterium]